MSKLIEPDSSASSITNQMVSSAFWVVQPPGPNAPPRTPMPGALVSVSGVFTYSVAPARPAVNVQTTRASVTPVETLPIVRAEQFINVLYIFASSGQGGCRMTRKNVVNADRA